MLLGMRHTGYIVSDIEKSIQFYSNILGFKIIQDFWDDSDYINQITQTIGANVRMVKLTAPDNSVIELLSYEGSLPKTQRANVPIYNIGEAHMALKVSSCEELYDLLVMNNIKVLSKPIISSEKIAKVFFCMDPDNYRIELVEMLNE